MPNKLTRVHVILFILTFITTTLAGAMLSGIAFWEEPEKLHRGLPFSLTLLFILLVHEFSHYFMSRRHHVPATLPYFIPAPSIIGTFGAIIKMKPPIPDRRALIDIGASGPIGGFIIALIASAVGLGLSDAMPLDELHKMQAGLQLGNSLIFALLSKIILNIDPDKYEIILHPVAFAGWIGLLVTALNLLPIGQLDGGHITYALLGERHEVISKVSIPVLGIMGVFSWNGWLVWAVLMLIIGYRHPPVVYPAIELDPRRKLIGWASVAIFILTFTPMPISGM
ncbi:MAG: site-2 protease family protein [Nitrospirae bacterium]|nr:site-2 protease family protein [Nitrospirota bacterium]